MINKLLFKIKKFFQWLSKSCQYAWFLRNDMDWDYAGLLNLMQYKMARMAKCIEDNNIIVANKRIAKQLRYAVYLIERYHSGEDVRRGIDAHNTKWGRVEKGLLNWGYPDNLTEEQIKQATKEFLDIWQKEEELLDRLFRHMRKNIQKWWD